MRLDTLTAPRAAASPAWLDRWPTEPGTLWMFCGWRSAQDRKFRMDPQLYAVAVRRMPDGSLAYVTDAGLLRHDEGGAGLWLRCEIVLPTREALDALGGEKALEKVA